MSAPLYNTDILRLAASIPHHQRLADPQASVEKRSATCGSRVTADVRMTDGRIAQLGLDVKACALGQASAALMAGKLLVPVMMEAYGGVAAPNLAWTWAWA